VRYLIGLAAYHAGYFVYRSVVMANQFKLSDFYPNSFDQTCHWCPLSQPYAGVDALLRYLDGGWKVQGDIGFDEHWFGDSRRILVYRFILTKRNTCVTMHVVWNPVLERLLIRFFQGKVSPKKQISKLASRIEEQASLTAIRQPC
jgi:hypothetical protein